MKIKKNTIARSFLPYLIAKRSGLILALYLMACQPEREPFFTVVLLPDTQYYTQSDRQAETYYAQTQYIARHKEDLNVKFVIHLGDITENNILEQWKIAQKAQHILDTAKVPYSMVPGNHDYPHGGHGGDRNTDLFNQHFGPDHFKNKPWYQGHFGNRNDNNYSFFESGDLKFLVMSLEFAPTNQALHWANEIIRENPERRVIIATHCYLTHDGKYNNCPMGYDIEGNSGEEMWRKLVRRHSNIFLVVSGHVSDSERTDSLGVFGNTVYQVLTDFQGEPDENGDPNGMGWLRTLTFFPGKNKIESKVFSVLPGVEAFTLDAIEPKRPGSKGDRVLNFTLEGYNMLSPTVYQFEKHEDSL